MLVSTIIMAVLAAILLAVGYFKVPGSVPMGLKTTKDMFVQIVPLLVFAFIVAGMVQVLIPRELIAQWVGAEAGFKGILIGTVGGALTPGGPFVCFPLAVGFLQAGAGLGAAVAYLTSWSLLGIARIPLEVGVLGWRFALMRMAVSVIIPPLAGLLAQAVFGSSWSSRL